MFTMIRLTKKERKQAYEISIYILRWLRVEVLQNKFSMLTKNKLDLF